MTSERRRARQMRAALCFALGSLAVVVGPAVRVGEGGERGQEHRAFEGLVAALGECSPLMDDPERRVTGARPA